MKVSIVVPAYNEEKNLRNTLHSLRCQTYPHIELIVVDNASTDATAAIAREFTENVFSETQPGYICAVTCGAEHATGDLITFCDGDTRYPVDWLERVVAQFEKNPYAVAVYGTSKTYDASPFLNVFNWAVYTGLIILSKYMWRFDNTAGFNFVIKKHAYDQVGGYSRQYRRMSPDIDLGRRLRRVGPLVLDLKSCVGTSFRRFQKGGKVKTLLFFLKSWAQMVFNKEPDSYESYNEKAR